MFYRWINTALHITKYTALFLIAVNFKPIALRIAKTLYRGLAILSVIGFKQVLAILSVIRLKQFFS